MSNSKKSAKGKYAEKPGNILLKGWKEILLRVKNQLAVDHVQIVSAGVAFYFFLALFPTISVFISVYGLVADTANIESQMTSVLGSLPADAAQMVEDIITDTIGKSDSTLGWSLIVSILLSLWSANSGTSTLFEGLNIAYDETDGRNFFKRTGITLLFTLGFIFMGLLCIFTIAGLPSLVKSFASETMEQVALILRWPILASLVAFSLSIVYKIAPDRDNPKFRWVSWGSIIATVLWLLGSLLFSWYIENYAGYSETYGNLAAVVILLLWFFLTTFIILLGGEINSEMEHQTVKDTTIGKDEPLGSRGAYHADHVAAGETKVESKEDKVK